ncbi:MAG: aldo/keto reductase [Acidimicrobiales bacterium]|jgi:aryl-alcohol dehydrogenase-like predicted oxidoreductase
MGEPVVTGSAVPQASDRILLAGSDISIPPLGVGTWAWGDKGTWGMGGYDQTLTESSIREAWEASIEAGVVLFDTAEIYGGGESERIIGRLLAADPGTRDQVVIATKFMPSPWKPNVHSALLNSARRSLERLGIASIDLYQIHGPISLRSHDAMAEALAAAHAEGLVQAVGVSNYSAKETRAIDAALRRRGMRLASNQVEFSLLRAMPERVGLLDCCRQLGVVPLAYSPLGQGRLSGKYSATNPPPRGRTFSAHPMAEVDTVVAELRRIGAAHDDRTPSQVALAWLVAKGAVPIPGAKNRVQAEQNAGALGWGMHDDELARLDAAALYGRRGIRERIWQHG